jgi:type I restriction enzyme, S subunit
MSGQLVEQWPIKTLDELINEGLITLGRGKVISRKDLAAIPGTYPVYSSAKQNEGKFGEYGLYMFDEELITWSVDGGGRLFHRPKQKFSVTNVGGTLRINDTSRLNYKFLYYCLTLLHSKINFDWVKKAHPSIIRKLYNEIPVPPLEVQQQIVNILDEVFQNIENRTSQAEHKLHNGKEMFQSVVANIFSQKGEGWTEKTLREVCENLDRKRIPITKNKRVSGEIPYYGASGIVDYVKDYIFDEDLLLVSEDGANLLARTYPIAFSISGKTWVNNHAHVLRFENMATQRFMEYYLNSIRLEPYVSGMAQPKLNQKSLNSIPVPEPPLNQQLTIVNKIDSLSQNVALLEENHRSEIESLVELKQSILQEAFNGTLLTQRV